MLEFHGLHVQAVVQVFFFFVKIHVPTLILLLNAPVNLP